MASLPLPATSQDGPSHFVAHLTGGQEVPLRETGAVGQTHFRLNADETALEYMLMVANIENVVAAHIHLGPQGTNGPVVAFLFGAVPPGERCGTGGTYVNVHTDDGAGDINTGPADFPAGEESGGRSAPPARRSYHS